MPKRRDDEFTVSAIGNRESYLFYVDRLTELSASLFEWTDTRAPRGPGSAGHGADGLDVRTLENTLFAEGRICVFRDTDATDDLIGLPFTDANTFDIYGYPTAVTAYSRYTGYQRRLRQGEFVVIYNNNLRAPSLRGALYYAKRLWNLDRIIDTNANAQKTPVLLQGSEKDRLSLRNLYKEYDGNAPVIYGTKNLDTNAFTVLRTEAPFIADKLYQLKSDLWNEALTYLGISNVNDTKKERMIVDEVERAQGGTIASRWSRLQARRDGCEAVNDLFGTSLSVRFRDTDVSDSPDASDEEDNNVSRETFEEDVSRETF